MKYAQMKGEDIAYYKVLMYVLSSPENPCQSYVLSYLRQCGLLEDEKVIEIRQEELISKDLMLELLKIPNGSIFRRFINYIGRISLSNVIKYLFTSRNKYMNDEEPWKTPFELDDIVIYSECNNVFQRTDIDSM